MPRPERLRPLFGPRGLELGRVAGGATAALAVAAFAVAPTAARAESGAIVAEDGQDPAIAVDAAGTGHLAFPSSSGPAPQVDDYSYCRLPRGTTICAPRTRLVLPQGLSGTSFGRPFVFEQDGRVIVGGFFSGNTNTTNGIWAWTSTNGGASFGAGKRISTELSIHDAVLGPGTNSVSATNAITGGGAFVNGSLVSGSPANAPVSLTQGLVGNNEVVASTAVGLINSNTPIFAAITGNRLIVRRFNSQASGGFNVAANWLPAQQIDTDAGEPTITEGPSGTYLGHETGTYKDGGYPLAVRRIADDGTVGPAVELGRKGANVHSPDLAQDASGRIAVAYVDTNRDGRLSYQWSKRGVHWSDPIDLSAPGDASIYFPKVAMAPDGGGWVVAGTANPNTPVRVWPLDPKGDADPGVPAPPSPPGGGPPADPPLACPAQIAVSSEVKAQVRTSDCFKDAGKGRFTTTGSVRVNGIDFASPGGSGKFTVDTKAHTVEASGPYTVQAGSIVLQKGSRTWNVTQPQTIDDLGPFGVKLFGLGLKGKADVAFDAKGAVLQVNVDLPSPFDGIRGMTKLRTTMASGLQLDGLSIHADTLPIGPVEIRNLNVVYTGANDGLEGNADVYLPPAAGKAISASFGFANGTFKHAELEAGTPLPGFPLPLWGAPPVLLNRVGIAATNNDKGFKLAGGLELVAGAQIAGFAPLSINALPSSGGGAYLFIPKKGDYAEIGASGKVLVLDIPLASGGMRLRTDGPLNFWGGASVDFGITSALVQMEGGINLSNADFYAGGKGQACVNFIALKGCGEVKGIMSSIGFAACGSIGELALGFDYEWGESTQLGDCRYEEFKPASLSASAARAKRLAARGVATRLQAAGGAQTVVLPGGPRAGLRVKGGGGRPGFTLAGPAGRSLTVPPGLAEPVLGAGVAALPVGPDEIELQVKDPAGTWTVTPADGSAIAAVTIARALPTPKASASVTKTGGRGRAITVKASNLGTQRLLVREVLPGGAASELGVVRKNGSSALRFTPTDGPGGKRALEAVVIAGDRQVDVVPLGSYVAPAPAKLAAPRSVTLKRSKTALTVRWKKVAGAARYRIRVSGSDGRLQILTADGKASRIQVADLTADDRVQIKVSAVAKQGVEGKSRKATSKATKPPKKKTAAKKR